MKQTGIADLKNNLSRYLAYVREGGEVMVFDRDTPVARLVPFVSRETGQGKTRPNDEYWTEQRLAEMERRGIITRGDPRAVREWLKTHHPVKLPPGSGSVVQTLITMRDEDTR